MPRPSRTTLRRSRHGSINKTAAGPQAGNVADLRLIEDWTRLQEVLTPFLVRCGAAALCGGMVGLERELRRKPAGFRTNILICVGAAMYMTVGLLVSDDGR